MHSAVAGRIAASMVALKNRGMKSKYLREMQLDHERHSVSVELTDGRYYSQKVSVGAKRSDERFVEEQLVQWDAANDNGDS